jgi:HK97 family phage major capsid protein
MAYAKKQRQEMDRLAVQMQTIVGKAKKENDRGLTSAERETFSALEVAYSALEESVKMIERADSITDHMRETESGRFSIDEMYLQDSFRTNSRAQREKDPVNRAFSKYLRNGLEALDSSERPLLRFLDNGPGIRNAMSTTSGSQGGYVVPTGFSGLLEEAKKWFGGVKGVVDSFQTETGNPWPWPTINDTTNRGRIIGQNQQIAEQDVAFNQVTFNAYIGTSDLVLIPLALMEDAYFDMDALVARLLGTRLGRLYNWKCTVGTGNNEPAGIVTAAAAAGNVLQLGAGNTTNISYSNLVDLESSVDPAYRENETSRWMFSDPVLKTLKKLVDGNQRPLWQPGLTASFQQGAAVITGAKPKIMEHDYIVNNDMPAPAPNAYSTLFGDMNTFKVREVTGGTTVMRLVERYADYLQVGFTAFQRFDSNLIDAGTHPVAVLQQSSN